MTNEISFVTFFSKEYTIYGLTLIDSILRLHDNAVFYVFPLDQDTKRILIEKRIVEDRIKVIEKLSILEAIINFEKQGRSRAEAIFSVKPMIIEVALDLISRDTFLFYCDADLYFFKQIPVEFTHQIDILLTKHLFKDSLKSHNKYGRYNAGFIGFRKGDVGEEALKWWIKKCIEKCSKIPDADSFADQKYLEQFEKYGELLSVIADPGVNQSLWIEDRNLQVEAGPRLNGSEVLCYHFHGLRANAEFVDTDIGRYGRFRKRREVIKHIYRPYIRAMESNLSLCEDFLPVLDFKISYWLRRLSYVRWKTR